MASVKKTERSLPKILRIMHARPKLFVSVFVGIAAGWLIPAESGGIHFLIGWDVGVLLYLCIVCWTFRAADSTYINALAEREDEGRVAILVLTVVATIASIAAIIALLGLGQHDPLQLGFATATVALSWAFVHLIFALHYAHEYYTGTPDTGGLSFPGRQKPDYWDFAYFSFVIGMTFQVSDVRITSREIRRVVLAHAIVAFFFNVALLAIVINIAASAITNH